MKLANRNVVGQLIKDPFKRQQWFELVIALQNASEKVDGPLNGWVFHGTDRESASFIDHIGLMTTHCCVSGPGDQWIEKQGVHFGSANVAAFFAEDLIESKENSSLDLVIYGASLDHLKICGEFAADGYMYDVPLESRIRATQEEIDKFCGESNYGWDACLRTLETVVVLGPVPRNILVPFRSANDVITYCNNLEIQQSKPKRLRIR